MKAFYIAIFLMIFFLVMSIVSSFDEFEDVNNDGSNFQTENASLNSSYISDDVNTMFDETNQVFEKLKQDPSIFDYFAVFLYGLKLVLEVILRTIRYIIFFADVLISFGIPVIIAVLIQLLIYLSYVFSLVEIFTKQGG